MGKLNPTLGPMTDGKMCHESLQLYSGRTRAEIQPVIQRSGCYYNVSLTNNPEPDEG
jgi:hypothetical protein